MPITRVRNARRMLALSQYDGLNKTNKVLGNCCTGRQPPAGCTACTVAPPSGTLPTSDKAFDFET
jgi:hypothetical protein